MKTLYTTNPFEAPIDELHERLVYAKSLMNIIDAAISDEKGFTTLDRINDSDLHQMVKLSWDLIAGAHRACDDLLLNYSFVEDSEKHRRAPAPSQGAA
ncbi:MAG: hypothetical protein IT541_16080 [Hyphomicrobiales bacterium]|nr:hypothetical protein [Hyphomicrobiales bacterium]